MKNVRSKFLKNEVQTSLYFVGAVLLIMGRLVFFNRPTTWAILLVTLCAVALVGAVLVILISRN